MRSDDIERLAELQRSGAIEEIMAGVQKDLFTEWLEASALRDREEIWAENKILAMFRKRINKAVNRGDDK